MAKKWDLPKYSSEEVKSKFIKRPLTCIEAPCVAKTLCLKFPTIEADKERLIEILKKMGCVTWIQIRWDFKEGLLLKEVQTRKAPIQFPDTIHANPDKWTPHLLTRTFNMSMEGYCMTEK